MSFCPINPTRILPCDLHEVCGVNINHLFHLSMSLTRSSGFIVTGGGTTSKLSLSRFTMTCPYCLYRIPTVNWCHKRRLQTITPHRPSRLTIAHPPHSTVMQEASVPGKKLHERDTTPWSRPSQVLSLGLSKAKAPISESASPDAAAAAGTGTPVGTALPEPEPAPSKLRRAKFKPRKPPMTLTSTAVAQIRNLLTQPDPKLIRIGVKNRGCSGLAYHLEYVDKAGTFDEAVEQDGVRVLIDSKALFSIIGSEMDWVEDKLSNRFIFKNPNISESSRLLCSHHTMANDLQSGAMRVRRIF